MVHLPLCLLAQDGQFTKVVPEEVPRGGSNMGGSLLKVLTISQMAEKRHGGRWAIG